MVTECLNDNLKAVWIQSLEVYKRLTEYSNMSSRTLSYCDSRRSEKRDNQRKPGDRSPASRGYPKECTDFDEFSMQGDNRAVRYRTAHLQWLLDNNVFAFNSADEWQPDLRRWTPSSSARYPLRMKRPKPALDPEALAEDFHVHVYHSKKDRLWVKQWISRMLEANRFSITTNQQPSKKPSSRIILVLTPELFNEPSSSGIQSIIQGKTVLGIKLRDCDVPEEIEKEYDSYMDMTTTDFSDLTFHINFMFRVQKSLKLPLTICSA